MSAGPPPLPQDPSYEARLTYFEKKRVYRIRGGALEIIEEGNVQGFPLNQIQSIRCRFYPTRFQVDRYEMLLTFSTGLNLKIGNQLFAGFAQFEDRSPDYRTFVLALHKARVAQQPPCKFYAGVTALSFWLNALFLGSVLLGLLALVILVATSIPMIAIVKFALLIVMVPIAINWFRKNRPREYDGRDIPADVLPLAGS